VLKFWRGGDARFPEIEEPIESPHPGGCVTSGCVIKNKEEPGEGGGLKEWNCQKGQLRKNHLRRTGIWRNRKN